MSSGNDRDSGMDTDLILFVTGDSPRSVRARANLARAIEQIVDDRVTVRHIDLLQDTEGVSEYGLFATPALIRVRENGGPAVLYGDLSNDTTVQRFLSGLDGRGNA